VDDWAFGNEVEARPWDYEREDEALRSRVDRFLARRYCWAGEPGSAEHEPVDSALSSALASPLELTREFKANYRRWLEQEVFQQSVDWDQLIEPGYLG